jgi:hypothetical protein
MAEEQKFETKLLRLLAAELHYANMARTAQEKYGKCFSDLEKPEQAEIHKALSATITDLYLMVTPTLLSSSGSTEARLCFLTADVP